MSKSQPPPCDPEVMKKGLAVAILAGPASQDIEDWVKAVAKEAKTKVDWNFAGGRAVIRVLADAKGVLRTLRVIEQTKEKLNRVYLKSQTKNWDGKPYTSDEQKDPLMFSWMEDAQAVMAPQQHVEKHEQEVKRREIWNRTIDAKLLETTYLVEATSYEQLALWQQWCEQHEAEWVEESQGFAPTVGTTITEEPIAICVSWAVVAGKRIGFWYPMSQVVDHRVIDAWIKTNFPNVKSTADAMNFGNIINSIRKEVGYDFVKFQIKDPHKRCTHCNRKGY